MGMAEDDRGKASRRGIQIELVYLVKHVKMQTANFYHLRQWQKTLGATTVYVASHCEGWRNIFQLAKNIHLAHIAGVKNIVAAIKCGDYFRTKKAVRIGNDTDLYL